MNQGRVLFDFFKKKLFYVKYNEMKSFFWQTQGSLLLYLNPCLPQCGTHISTPMCLQYYGALKGILCDFIEWWLLSAKIMDIIRAFSIFTTSKYSHSKYSYSLCVWLDCPVACFMESEDEIVFVKRHELLMEMNSRDKLSCNHWLFHSMEIWKGLYINLTKNCFFLGNSSPALSNTAIAAFLH